MKNRFQYLISPFKSCAYSVTSVLFSIVFLLLLLSTNEVIAQPQAQQNGQLAQQYFAQGDYEKALVYFEKNYDFDPFGSYDGYLQCLIALKDFSEAEKLIKKQMKKANGATSYLVDLGNLYEIQGLMQKANEQYDKAIKTTKPDVQQYQNLANRFIDKGNSGYAIKTYLEGRKNLRGAYQFSFELAEAYAMNSDGDNMLKEYLDILETSPQSLPNLQAVLQNKILLDYNGTLNDKLRVELLKRIQKNPNNTSYSELLYWLLLQEKDFESAIIQAKSLDKRLGENGVRVITLGQMAASNQQYQAASECFQYVLDKGKGNAFYITARISLINASNNHITTQSNYTSEDLKKLDTDYSIAIEELGKNAGTSELLRSYAHLKAFYMNETDSAVSMLETLVGMSGTTREFQAKCKLDLGDILVFRNEVWDALLYYGQVDKDFKHDELGREAKFRTARTYYYEGQFEWAAAQLNILKAATTQLISNDAMQLALLIQDNTTIDTNTIPLQMYATADLLEFQNKHNLAMETLDSITVLFPYHSITDEVWYKKAEIYKNTAQYDSAIFYYTMVYEKYGEDIWADDALYSLAILYDNTLNEKTKAKDLYEKILQKYPGSLFASDARKRFRVLRGDKVN